ncbi:MAG: HpcH/HpaI aldolase/citrate lyase family protein [Burkholderiales bacterium]
MNRRRSWLIAPAHDPEAVKTCLGCDADVLVLDLEYSVPPKHKEAARSGLNDLVRALGPIQRELFVRIDRATRWADAAAAVVRGVNGIVFAGAEQAGEIAELDQLVAALEKERGLELGAMELVLMLESAPGFWNAGSLAQASPRVTALGVGRVDLTMQLGPVPQDEFRLYRYLMTRAVVAARTFGKQALGAHWRPGSRGGLADARHTARAAREARLMGFEGCLCAAADQVAAVNTGFAPG